VKEATLVRKLTGWKSDARLYVLSGPVDYEDDGGQRCTINIVVSKAMGYLTAETYIYPADAGGNVLDWCELDGSQKRDISHDDLLREAGWIVRD